MTPNNENKRSLRKVLLDWGTCSGKNQFSREAHQPFVGTITKADRCQGAGIDRRLAGYTRRPRSENLLYIRLLCRHYTSSLHPGASQAFRRPPASLFPRRPCWGTPFDHGLHIIRLLVHYGHLPRCVLHHIKLRRNCQSRKAEGKQSDHYHHRANHLPILQNLLDLDMCIIARTTAQHQTSWFVVRRQRSARPVSQKAPNAITTIASATISLGRPKTCQSVSRPKLELI